jgi:hypothetical protein
VCCFAVSIDGKTIMETRSVSYGPERRDLPAGR